MRLPLGGRLGSLGRGVTASASPDFMSALVEHLADPVIACDAEGNIVTLNRSARAGGAGFPARSGPPTRLTQERWAEYFQLYPPGGTELLATDELPLLRALRGESVRDEKLEARGEDGARVVLNVSGGPVLDAHGQIQGAVLVMQDCTERTTADLRVQLGSHVAANIALGVSMVSALDGQIVWANERWERLFGYEPGELIGSHISVVNAPTQVSPEDHAQAIFDALERDGVWDGEIHNRRKDGSTLWTHANVSRFEHPKHGTVWLTASTDISERKASGIALHSTAERFRAVFDDAPVGIALVGTDEQLIDANRMLCNVLGWHRDELVGRPVREIVHPEDAGTDADLAARVFNGEIPRYRISKRYVTRLGQVVPMKLTSTVLRGPDGRPLYSVDVVEESHPNGMM